MFTMIACMTKNRLIGIDGKMPWKQRTDMQRFKSITYGHDVLMGRKTFESFGKKFLPGRRNIILTRDKELADEVNYSGYTHFCLNQTSLQEFILTNFDSPHEIFVIGGSEIYNMFEPLAKKIFLTELQVEIKPETRDLRNDSEFSYFPELSLAKWERIAFDAVKASKDAPDDYDAIFQTFIRE